MVETLLSSTDESKPGLIMEAGRQIFALSKKNFIIRKRHYILTAVEFFIPLVLSLLLMVIPLNVIGDNKMHDAQYYSYKNLGNVSVLKEQISQSGLYRCTKNCIIAFKPNTSDRINKLMNNLKKEIDLIHGSGIFGGNLTVVGFNSEEAINENYTQQLIKSSLSIDVDYEVKMAILFQQFNERNLKYTIRCESMDTIKLLFVKASEPYSTFNLIQHLLDTLYMDSISNDSQKTKLNETQIYMQKFPHPKYKSANSIGKVSVNIVVTLLSTMFIVFIPSLVIRIVQEKSSGMREMLRAMGLRSSLNYFAWMLNGFVILFIYAIIICIFPSIKVMNHNPPFYFSDKFLIWIFITLYCISVLFFSVFISVFFTKAIFAVITSVILVRVTLWIPALLLDDTINPYGLTSSEPAPKLLSCLLPNGALYWGIKIILSFESKGSGLHWNVMNKSYNFDDSLTMSEVFAMMITSWFFYALLIWYLDAVLPWQTGVPRKPYFFLMKSYWIKNKGEDVETCLEDMSKSEFHEKMPTGQNVGIDIRNLRKEFSVGLGTKTAVDGINLQIHEGQITALLGHNGAGKTTTISIITGMYSASSGTVLVNGYDVRKDINSARKSLGYCPQHSMFIAELTVKEHLEFICSLKGYTRTKMKPEINKIIELVQLVDKKDVQASMLSGGMKRKLSLAMAVVGETKVLLLDEPTSGLDPEARRQIWNILQSIRKDKTIILTTHYMEEADALGDRIAIMTDGNIFCSGSSLFLKGKFGAGYHLRMITKKGCDFNSVLNMVEEHVPAKIERNSGRELSFIITSETTKRFPSMLQQITDKKEELLIESFGLSVTTMEDVFLRVNKLADEKKYELVEPSQSDENLLDDLPFDKANLKSATQVTGIRFYFLQIFALICKRFHHNKRQISSLIMQILIPLFVVTIMVLFTRLIKQQNGATHPKLSLDLHKAYGDTKSFVRENDVDAFKIYSKFLQEENAKIIKSDDIQSDAMKIGEQNLADYIHRYIVGAEINETFDGLKLNALFNPLVDHSSPISLNLIENTKCQIVHPETKIEVFSHPLPSSSNFVSFFSVAPMIAQMFTPTLLAFLTSTCVLYIIMEKTSKSKHLQLMTELNPAIFWLSHGLWDFLICQAISTVISIIFVTETSIGVTRASSGALFLLFIFYNWSAIPFTYISSFFFKRPAFGFALNLGLNIILGMFGGIIGIFSNGVMASKTTQVFATVIKIIPSIALSSSIGDLLRETSVPSQCKKYMKYCSLTKNQQVLTSCCNVTKPYDPFGLGRTECGQSLLFLFFTGVLYMLIIAALEGSLHKRFMKRIQSYTELAPRSGQDSDVLKEENEVAQLIEGAHSNNCEINLIIQKLRKNYQNFTAVNFISFFVPSKTCFGLLGINGAGKTTTFSMLTGELEPTSGDAYYGPSKVSSKEVQKQIGYCPQFDAHLELLTGEELLYLFARLRGVSSQEIKNLVENVIKMVNLEEHATKRCGVYSGGNKRKLSIAISIINLPPLLLLDEPTSGIDPTARRQIWKLLTNVKSTGISIILSSHSMEECEALCDKLTIMVRGQLRCIGNVSHLKTKFGQGYTILAKVKLLEDGHDDERINELTSRVKKELPSVNIRSQTLGILTYHVVDVEETWAHMFAVMEKIKIDLNLEDYSITATTLEEVFLSFAKNNENDPGFQGAL